MQIDNRICIGCGYCALACGYEARVPNRAEPHAYRAPHDFTPTEKIGYFQEARSCGAWKGCDREVHFLPPPN